MSGISQAISVAACDTVFGDCPGPSAGRTGVLRPELSPAIVAGCVPGRLPSTIALSDLFLPSLDEASALLGIATADALIDWSHERVRAWSPSRRAPMAPSCRTGAREWRFPATGSRH
jgi:2-dehydro-3-deoxygluconokinase